MHYVLAGHGNSALADASTTNGGSMSNDGRYNGWANYETWRVNLELFDGWEPDGEFVTAASLEEWAGELVDSECRADGFSVGIVGTFLAAVNWQEIADAINEAYELTEPDADDPTTDDNEGPYGKSGRE